MDETEMSNWRDGGSRRAFLACGARIAAASGLAAVSSGPARGEAADGPVDHVLRAAKVMASPDGRMREVWGYNGQLPGPLLRVKEGARVRIRVENHVARGDLDPLARIPPARDADDGRRRGGLARGRSAPGLLFALRLRADRPGLTGTTRTSASSMETGCSVRSSSRRRRRSRRTTGTRCSSSTIGSTSRATRCSPAS